MLSAHKVNKGFISVYLYTVNSKLMVKKELVGNTKLNRWLK